MESILENPALYFETKASEANISIDALCDEAGISRSTLTRWKSNSNGATFSSIKKLQKALTELTTGKRRSHTKLERDVNTIST